MNQLDQSVNGPDLLAPSERLNLQRGCRYKLLTDRGPGKAHCNCLAGYEVVRSFFIGDSSFAVHGLAHAIVRQATLISRLRLHANLFARHPGRTSFARTIGARKTGTAGDILICRAIRGGPPQSDNLLIRSDHRLLASPSTQYPVPSTQYPVPRLRRY